MKKFYQEPDARISCFSVQDIMDVSRPGENETEIDDLYIG